MKVAYIFKIFRDQNCLMVAKLLDQVTYVCEKYNNLEDSKSTFIITGFKFSDHKYCRQLFKIL